MPGIDEPDKLRQALAKLQDGDWQRAHEMVQDLESPAAAWLHGIVHLIEGDESNARYWYTLAQRPFPGLAAAPAEMARLAASLSA